ncbi:glycosylhydrolase-like jelly roll fold domain-containing protein [Streptomyces sp. YJ-C3]
MNDRPNVEIVTTHDAPLPSRRAVLALAGAAGLAAGLSLTGAGRAAAASPEDGFDSGRFADPRADSMPTVLWFWNGAVTPDLVREQLADLRDKGVHEVLVFPFQTEALEPAFFTEDWFSVIEFTLREAQRHAMHLWLFNDDYFPSGRAAGLVVGGGTVGGRTLPPRPEHGLKGVGHTYADVSGGTTVPLVAAALSVDDGRLLVDAGLHDGVVLLRDGSRWTDYTVHATVRPERSTAGLMLRCTDEANGLLVELRTDGGVDVWRQRDGRFENLRRGDAVDGFDASHDHELTVALDTDHMKVSLDGTALPSVADLDATDGRIGVRATADQRSSWAALSVSDPQGKDLYRQDFGTQAALDDFDLPDPPALAAAAAWPQGASSTDELVDLTSQARAGKSWTAPSGQWRLALFPVRELAQASGEAHNYLDLMDDTAVDLFLDTVAGEYVRRFPWAVGTVLRGFADDEPFLASSTGHGLNALPWSPTLDDELARLGTRPGAALAAAHTDGLGASGERLRGVFWRAVSNRYADAYYRRQGAWMAARKLRFISNPLWDEYGPAEQLGSSGNLHTTDQWAQVPGTDLIFDHYQRGYHRTLSRWPASAAHQLGKERVYLEAMGGTGWPVTPALTREVIGAFAVRGVNHTLLHARFSNDKDIVYPPPFQSVNPWWELSRPLNDWIGRLMEACRAPARPRTALLQPQRAVECVQDTAGADRLDEDFVAAVHALEDAQIDFDLLDEGALGNDPALRATAEPKGDGLVVGRQEYRTVVLPTTPVLALATVRTLERFVRGGGAVVAVGDLPVREAGGNDADLESALHRLFADGRGAHQAATTAEAATAVVASGTAAATVIPHTSDVRVMRLARGRDAAFVVTSERATPLDLTLTLPAAGVPEVWDPDTGRVTATVPWRSAPFPGQSGSGTTVDLRIEAKATLVVVVRASGRAPLHVTSASAQVLAVRASGQGAVATVRADKAGTIEVSAAHGSRRFKGSAEAAGSLDPLPLDGPWTFRFDRDGSAEQSRELGDWTALDPRYSGSASYEKTVELKPDTLSGRVWALDLGDVRDVAEITVNGTPVGPRLWAPYRADVTEFLRPGSNDIRVRVTNTGANERGETVPSGLIGPVRLYPSRSVEVRLSAV